MKQTYDAWRPAVHSAGAPSRRTPRVFRPVFARAVLTALLACVSVTIAHAARPIVLRNVDVITMSGPEVLRDRTVVVRDGVIESVDAKELPAGATIINAKGKYLMPGLCDMHVHVGDESVRTLAPEAVEPAIARTQGELLVFLRSGITCMRNMSGSPFHLELRKKLESGEVLGPRMVTTSPIVDGDPPVWPFATKLADPAQARDLVRSFKDQGYDTIKVYNGLSRDAYAALTVAARGAGMKVSGHVPFSIGIWGALAAGQHSIEHFRGYDFNPAMAPGASSANDRFKWWFSLSDEDLRRLARATAEAGIYNAPTLNLMELAIGGEERKALAKRREIRDLPPGLRKSVLDDFAVQLFSSEVLKAMRDSLPVQQKLVRYMVEAGAPVMAGTDTPALGAIPGAALHREIELMAAAGIGNFEALRTATVVPARYFQNDGTLGTVEAGKQADLLLLDANPLEDVGNTRKIAGVMLRGEWFSAADLTLRMKRAAKAESESQE